MTKMIPIVAVVDEDCFHALSDHISSVEQPTPLLQAVMTRNGWTLDALVAGACLKGALLPDLVKTRANPQESTTT